jgi:hypothetical protein
VLTKRDPNPQYSGYYPEIDFTLNNLDGGIYKTAIDTTWSFTFMGVVSTVKAHYNICGFTTRDNGKTVGCRVTRVNLTGTLVDATVTDAYGKVHAVANF